ncbi:MAG: hypothetical protein ABI193_18955 [Minicystis sp.]
MRPRLLALLLPLLLAACDRLHHDPASLDAGAADRATPSSSASAVPLAEPPPPPSDETPIHAPSPVESQRVLLRRLADDPQLARHRDTLLAHFDVALDTALEVQTARLPGNRRARLLMSGPKDRRPMILTVDAEGNILWTKERPLAGIHPGTSEMVIAPGPAGQVILIWYDKPSQVVAQRIWDTNGGIFADFQLLSIESCESLSALYWPGKGWVVAAAQPLGTARLQLLDETGRLAWGAGSHGLPWVSRSGAPVTLALDGDESVIAAQVGDARKGAAGPDQIYAVRYDARGAPLWEDPATLGTIARAPAGISSPRIVATRSDLGVLTLALPPGASRPRVELRSSGVVEGAHPAR